jgi:hypothetical protein
MLLNEGEFIGASIPQHLFLVNETCKQCHHPAHFTVLIVLKAHLGAPDPARKVALCKSHWERATREVPRNPMNRPEYPLELAKFVLPQKSDNERVGYQ